MNFELEGREIDRKELNLIGQLEKNAPAAMTMDSPPAVEDAKLELSLGLSSGEGASSKRARENNEEVVEKKAKMAMPAIFPWPICCCSSCLISDWLPISMEDFGNNEYEQRAKLNITLETNQAAACDLKAEVVGETSSPESQNSGTSVLLKL